MIQYYLAYCEYKLGKEFTKTLKTASALDPKYCFPNTLYDFVVLDFAVKNSKDSKALYYLGNLLYDKKRPDEAIALWEESVKLDGEYPTVKRNLSLAYFNKRQDADNALKMLEDAFHLNTKDARVFYELDQLYKKLAYPFEERLTKMEKYIDLVHSRDDFYLEYITIFNSIGEHAKALSLIESRTFQSWEGGEGKIPTQFVTANVELAKIAISNNDAKSAIEYLGAAKVYPLNIGEGKLAGAQENNVDYYLGLAYELAGEINKSKEHFALASVGLAEPTSAMFYNDQPPHMIFYQGLAHAKLGNNAEALSRFNKLVDYGEKHMFDNQTIDYFAVSLPDFLVFEDDLNRKNQIHCKYMMGLGYLGLSKNTKAIECLNDALKLDPNHQGAMLHLKFEF